MSLYVTVITRKSEAVIGRYLESFARANQRARSL